MERVIETPLGLRHLGGWKAPRPHPDRLHAAFRAPAGLQVPDRIDHRHRMLPMRNQGADGDCTGQSAREAMEFLQPEGQARVPYSAKFPYAMTRLREGTPLAEDSGASVSDTFKVAEDTGVCRDELWGDEHSITEMPSAEALADAAQHRLTLAFLVPGWNEMIACLAQGFPVNFGVAIPSSVRESRFFDTGTLRYFKAGDTSIGGHSVLAVGYDLARSIDGERGAVLASFHWGQFGPEAGYVWVPARYFYTGTATDMHSPRLAQV